MGENRARVGYQDETNPDVRSVAKASRSPERTKTGFEENPRPGEELRKQILPCGPDLSRRSHRRDQRGCALTEFLAPRSSRFSRPSTDTHSGRQSDNVRFALISHPAQAPRS